MKVSPAANQFPFVGNAGKDLLLLSHLGTGREGVNSDSGLYVRPHRAKMGDRMLADLVFLKCNKHV